MAGSMTEIPVNGDAVPAYISLPPSGSGPGVVVIQEWWGLVPHIRDVADRLAAQGRIPPEWGRLVTDLSDLSTVEVEQDGCRALLRTAPGPTIDPVCRALGLVLPPVFQEMPPAPAA